MFFFFDDIGEVGKNEIVNEACEKYFFSQLKTEGDCDINHLLGKPRLSKLEVERKLKKIQSPLAILYSRAYSKTTSELDEKMLPILYGEIKKTKYTVNNSVAREYSI